MISSGTSTSSTISTASMQAIIEKLRCEGTRSSTKSNYYLIWKKFNEFVIKLDQRPNSWEDRLVLFVGHLVNNKRKSSTIRSYVSAIRKVLRDDGEILNENSYLLTSLTRACKLINDKVHTRLPIKKYLLLQILDIIPKIFYPHEQPYLVTLYRALFSTAYFGLFRVGELTLGEHVVKACDVHIGKNKDKLMFVLHTSKTHWFNTKPQSIKISSKINEKLPIKGHSATNCLECPFENLRKYLNCRKSRKDDSEQFFIFKDRSPVTPTNFRSILKKSLELLKLDASMYSTSGFRSGRAIDLAEIGISVESLKNLGRWKSSAVFTYLKY